MIRNATKKEIECIEKRYNLTVSKFMRHVLDILSYVYGGLHHTDVETQFKKRQYCETNRITYNDTLKAFATYDYDQLTKLVVLAHDKGIRICLFHSDARYSKGLTIQFNNRMGKRSKDLSMNQRHPTLSEAIKKIRDDYQISK